MYDIMTFPYYALHLAHGLVYSDEDTGGNGDDESSESDHANMVICVYSFMRSHSSCKHLLSTLLCF